jgi:16S rRNA (cytidine1402-2'-O)-methyltransferase
VTSRPDRTPVRPDPAPGALIMVAAPVGSMGTADDLSPRTRDALAAADVVAGLDSGRTGRLLRSAGLPSHRLLDAGQDVDATLIPEVLAALAQHQRVVVVTDGGVAGSSDGGDRLVRAAADAGYDIEAIPGPSAAIAALVVSGLPTGRWCLEGFLPSRASERAPRLSQIAREPRTAILYETGDRLARTLADLAAAAPGERGLALARLRTHGGEEGWGFAGESVAGGVSVIGGVWRGTLAAGAERIAATTESSIDRSPDPGAGASGDDYVLVIEGAKPPPIATDSEAVVRLTACLAAGASRKAAVAEVAEALRLPRRQVYQLALDLPRPPPPGVIGSE